MAAAISPEDHYWQNLKIQTQDLDAISAHLLDVETPLSPEDLAAFIVAMRARGEAQVQAKQAAEAGSPYFPKDGHKAGEKLVFPTLGDRGGEVVGSRPARTLNGNDFSVIEVEMRDGSRREFAAGLASHALNAQPIDTGSEQAFDGSEVMDAHGAALAKKVETALRENDDFVYIAGRWFPKALIIEVTEGQLNLAEALLDMASGGPLLTEELLGQVELPQGNNPKLAAFSLDLALQEDKRFDEVGSTGEVRWFLRRLEPKDVQEPPVYLRYEPIEHDRALLNDEMLSLERFLDDELSPIEANDEAVDEVEVRLIFPHWRSGSLPLTERMARLFPAAYESPRVRFDFVDGETGKRFPGWVVRSKRHVDGLRKWYESHGLLPGSYVRARRGEQAGEIIVEANKHRASKEWVRTALIGADGAVVYALLKQTVESAFDERMMIYMPSQIEPLDEAWKRDKRRPLDKVVVSAIQELAKLSPQNHVHASELYAVTNMVMRCPPAPILALLAARADIQHVGDLHYRMAGSGDE
ncbi:MAG: hypothetical protein DWG76_08280 [Chloroflexi bacterium]|nr:hypothetical protein [Chloroflexota bacterium]